MITEQEKFLQSSFDQKPKILYITEHCPYSPSYGAQIRVLNIGKILQQIGNVSLVIASSEEIDQESLDRTKNKFDLKRIIKIIPNNNRNLINRIRHEFDPYYLHIHGYSVSPNDHDYVIKLAEQHDVVWIHTIKSANVFRIFRWPHSVLDIDDILSRYYMSEARTESNLIRCLLNYRMSLIWLRHEQILKKRFDTITVCSKDDKKYLGNDDSIRVIPNGFDVDLKELHRTLSIPPRLGFIGTFRYEPNQEGIKWFIHNVWPVIKHKVPDARLRLVGHSGNIHYPELGPDIDGLGFVQDPSEEIASWSCMIVPILTGAGTRVKIAEGFSRKCPIVSTSLGAFGYEVSTGVDCLIADNAQDFAAACTTLLKNPEIGVQLSENASKKFLNNWSWDVIGEQVVLAVKECLQSRKSL